jgi:energy-coupling factor transporter ATP-binding protein EcfA2
MCAIGRALMTNPSVMLLDEPSMGLAPQIVEEVFEIVKDLNRKEKVTFLLAEQNTNMALRYADYGYIMESGPHRDGRPGVRPGQQRRRQGVLPRCGRGASASPSRTARATSAASAGSPESAPR